MNRWYIQVQKQDLASAKLQRVGLMIKKVSYLTSTSLFMIKN